MDTINAKPEAFASLDADAIVYELGQAARRAAGSLATSTTKSRNAALRQIAAQIRSRAGLILEANAGDLAQGRKNGLDTALIDRLMLNPERVEAIAGSLDQIAELPDPVGREIESWERPNGLKIRRVAVPIGVVAVIYE
ncbi:MAG: gamma-glutamyl-phosphate reductase, partial [Wenzhouxiangellaceae bacterium]